MKKRFAGKIIASLMVCAFIALPTGNAQASTDAWSLAGDETQFIVGCDSPARLEQVFDDKLPGIMKEFAARLRKRAKFKMSPFS